MSEAGFFIQPLDSSNYSLLVPLMKDCFGMDVKADYFKWKYFDNPAGLCVGFIAIEKKANRAVAFYGAIPQKYMVDGSETIIYQACDTMTHTQYRKKSLFPVLAKECYDHLKDRGNFNMIGIGGTPQSFPVLKFFGWKTIFNFRNYFKPNIFCKFYFFKKYSPDKFVDERVTALPEQLLTDPAPAINIKSPRNPEQYKWRISNPNFQYKILSFKGKNNSSGVVVYYVHNKMLLLFDFIFNDRRSRKALIWYLSRIVAKNNYKGIVAFCQEKGFQSRLLKKSGFISNPFKKGPLSGKPPFLIFSDEETMEKYSDPNKWYVTAYDYDAM